MKTNSIPIDLQQALHHSIQASHLAGKILMQHFGRLTLKDVQSKSSFDFVTAVDRASEEAIIQYLQEFYPDYAIHAEESGKNNRRSPFQWLIDPLDGTKNFIHSFPLFSISIGLRYRESVVSSVVYVPVFEELFTAVKGGGAFLNGQPIQVSSVDRLSHCMLATGFPHRAKEYLEVYQRAFHKLFLEVSAIRRAGSAAIDLAYTACGRFDGFWEFKLNPWDIGAGILLVQEAGGIVTDPFGGENYFETGDVVAGPPYIHNELVRTLSPICRGKLGW